MKKVRSINGLLTRLKGHFTKTELKQVKEAYEFAFEAHKGQLRKSGRPYIIHPLRVAGILTELEQDSHTIIAALLHDTVEDCGNVSSELIRDRFGSHIQLLVDGVTNIGKLKFSSSEEAQAENYRKLLVATAKDIRVVIIKLADRLHNMRTLKHLSREKQIKIARETLEIYTPIANRLGMNSIKSEMEDLAFKFLDPKGFRRLRARMSFTIRKRVAFVNEVKKEIQDLVDANQITAAIQGRPKHLYSIHRKLIKQRVELDELYDLFGIRILVSDVKDCYQVLGLIHSKMMPMQGRFKDYIAMPKSNGYQSLHTTVIGPEGHPVEIQIRTKNMDEVAQHGVAAHWHYKEGASQTIPDKSFTWLRHILESYTEKTAPKEFLEDLKVDLFMDEVFVFTPKGDVKALTKGATALDFAYLIHSEVGNMCTGAKVNGHIVPLSHVLANGDRIEILTSKRKTPNLDWLEFVATRQAKTKIKQWFKRKFRSENIKKGLAKLERTSLVAGNDLKEILSQIDQNELFEKYHVSSLEELYLGIAQGDISSKGVVRYFIETLGTPEDLIPTEKAATTPLKQGAASDVMVLGETGVYVTFAKCCSPLPGDPISGIVTIGKGVSVHRADCHNILNVKEEQKGRLIEVNWSKKLDDKSVYSITLLVEGFDRIGILQEILQAIANSQTYVREVKTKLISDGRMRAIFSLDVKDISQLNNLKQEIANISDVFLVTRTPS